MALFLSTIAARASTSYGRRCWVAAVQQQQKQQQQQQRTVFNSSSVSTPTTVPSAAANNTQHPDVYDKTPEELRRMSRTLDESIVRLYN
jgi:transcription initiation factor TFIID subunit TAF12